MEKIEIIKACADHIDGILAVENLSFKIPWSRQSFIDEITKNDFAWYICAIINGQITGYAGMWQVFDEGHITNIAVHPEFRLSGVGSALLESLINHARLSGIKRMTLEVRKSNLPARGLYKKFKFKDGGFRKAYYADNNEDAIIMWLEEI
jgi:ribosomal-protein-alanine acetyltransferase